MKTVCVIMLTIVCAAFLRAEALSTQPAAPRPPHSAASKAQSVRDPSVRNARPLAKGLTVARRRQGAPSIQKHDKATLAHPSLSTKASAPLSAGGQQSAFQQKDGAVGARALSNITRSSSARPWGSPQNLSLSTLHRGPYSASIGGPSGARRTNAGAITGTPTRKP